MHTILDAHSPEPEHERKDIDTMDNYTKATTLPLRARKMFLESREAKVTLRGNLSESQCEVTTNIEMSYLYGHVNSNCAHDVDSISNTFPCPLMFVLEIPTGFFGGLHKNK
ncbi:hypothetical protein SK128_028270 [Halocaridina rubra]|uniref:Uncharacterized protein n=1 Tax=Halocaridina rubra TaxID=373956 RepID=A0AAN8WSS5_HALRR